MAAFMKLGDVKGEFQADELTGTSDSFFGDEIHLQVDGLNETTNFRPTKRASAGIVHPDFKTGYDTDPVDSLSETFGDGDPRILGPISGEGVFKPQDINTRGSVIVGDNHFTTAGGGDSITGKGRPMNVWTNGSATSFAVGRHHLEGQAFLREQFGALTDNIGGNAGPGGSTYLTETFEPASGMNNFGDSTNPVLEVGANSGPDGTTFMTGKTGFPTENLGGTAGPGGTSF